MKKRIICSLLCLSLAISPLTVYAEDVETELQTEESESIFTFRGIPWYSTKSDVEAILFEEGADEAGWIGNENTIYRLSGTDFKSTTSADDRVDGGGYRGWYSNVSVAGYEPSDTYACYIYPLNEDGTILKSDEDAEFYFGWYSFDSNDFVDLSAIYDDLQAKLISLYGDSEEEADKYRTTISWFDSQENQIRLLINADETYVALGYIAADADTHLDEMQAALDAESAAQEAEDRENNQDNVSGL